MESLTKKMKYYVMIDMVLKSKEDVFEQLLVVADAVISDKELNQLDTKDLLTEISDKI